jgi:hypothetical protein
MGAAANVAVAQATELTGSARAGLSVTSCGTEFSAGEQAPELERCTKAGYTPGLWYSEEMQNLYFTNHSTNDRYQACGD